MSHKKARVPKAYIQSQISAGIAKALEDHRIASYKRGYEDGSNDVKGTAAIHYAGKIEELNLALAEEKASLNHLRGVLKKLESDQRKMCKQIAQDKNALQEKSTQICNLTHSLDDVQSRLIVAQNQAKADAKKAEETEHKLRRTIQHLEQKITANTEQAVKANRQEVEQYFANLVAPATPSLLVDNWRGSWKWISTQCFALIIFFATTPIPAEVLAVLPDNIRGYVIAFTAFCGFLGRYLNQSKGVHNGYQSPSA